MIHNNYYQDVPYTIYYTHSRFLRGYNYVGYFNYRLYL